MISVWTFRNWDFNIVSDFDIRISDLRAQAMSRSLNKVTIIGNLTRDPELRYTPQGTAVCSFGVATNRQWTTDSGEKKDDVEFHNVVAWTKLAEICAQYLSKGRQVYLEGRLQTRKWTGQDEVERRTTEIVANDVIFLGSREAGSDSSASDFDIPDEELGKMSERENLGGKSEKSGSKTAGKKTAKSKTGSKKGKSATSKKSSSDDDDIPF